MGKLHARPSPCGDDPPWTPLHHVTGQHDREQTILDLPRHADSVVTMTAAPKAPSHSAHHLTPARGLSQSQQMVNRTAEREVWRPADRGSLLPHRP